MKIEYILVVVLALGILGFLGTSFVNWSDTAGELSDDATDTIEDISGSSIGG